MEAPVTLSANEVAAIEQGEDATRAWPHGRAQVVRSLLRNPLAVTGLVIIVILIGLTLAAPLLTSIDPGAINVASRFLPPSAQHPFGTDELGRDLFSRVLYGGRLSLPAPFEVVALALLVGSTIGAVAGYVGGVVDEVLMRLTDLFLAFPGIVLALAIAAALGPGLTTVVLAVAVVSWPWYSRLMRSQVVSVRTREYVEAGRALGGGDLHLLLRHVLPNSLTPVLTQATMDIGYTLLTIAGLSFLGLGAQPPTPEWGALLSVGRSYVTDQWWYSTFPGLAIFVAVTGFVFLGDGIRETLDPREHTYR
jgi:peptide/nickel transport system permease protein